MILSAKYFPWLYRSGPSMRFFVLPIVTCGMLIASVLPWLQDPLGQGISPWHLPIYVGWGFRSEIFNYGLLCTCCACYLILVIVASTSLRKYLRYPVPRFVEIYLVDRYGTAALLFLIPPLLLLLQYTFFDVGAINQLAQHKIQMLLIQQHIGYTLVSPRVVINPFALDVSTLSGRFVLLFDQLSFSILLPCVCSATLLSYRRLCSSSSIPYPPTRLLYRTKRIQFFVLIFLALLSTGLFSRVLLATACEYEAQTATVAGNYMQANWWLDKALRLNPDIDQLSSYHIQRGQIRYFLHHDDQSDESLAYLAFIAYQQANYQNAYQRLVEVWTLHHHTGWVVDEMDIILEHSAESIKPSRIYSNPELISARQDLAALPPLQLLARIDPNNVYVHYVLGLVYYQIHSYLDCTTQMLLVDQASTNSDLRSSAFTYIGLSEAGQGDYVDSRLFLSQAVSLDSGYYNNTAREELSGLR